jgi:hypothetical protein
LGNRTFQPVGVNKITYYPSPLPTGRQASRERGKELMSMFILVDNNFIDKF